MDRHENYYSCRLISSTEESVIAKASNVPSHPLLPRIRKFLVLKLQRQAIVKTITFGKYEKTHVCNIKKFKVFGGLEPENMMELLESGLKNDSMPETFDLKHVIGNDGNYFPIKYLKILPLQSWGPSFNFSIWHVQLGGVDDSKLVKSSIERFNSYRQKEVIRLCMKHFRRLEQPEVVETLQRVTGVNLEDSSLSTLYNLLVIKGDHSQGERFISDSVQKLRNSIQREGVGRVQILQFFKAYPTKNQDALGNLVASSEEYWQVASHHLHLFQKFYPQLVHKSHVIRSSIDMIVAEDLESKGWFGNACREHRIFLLRTLLTSRLVKGLQWSSVQARETSKRSDSSSRYNSSALKKFRGN